MGAIKERMKQDLEIRGLSENTQQSYLTCVKQFVGHFMISPERLGLNDIRSYQLYLIRERNVAESSFNVHVAALKLDHFETELESRFDPLIIVRANGCRSS